MRADALLSQFGYCSRRDAARWVGSGRVVCDGVVVRKVAQHVDPVRVRVDGEPVPFVHGLYVAFHKPLGCTCSHRDGGTLVYDLLPPAWLRRSHGVSTVGRLDKETSGLLLLTDDGAFLHALTSPKRHVEKVYEFECSEPVPGSAVELFAAGTLQLEGESTPCLPAKLELTGECAGRLTLREGRYHQVRRMLAAVGAPVTRLHRVAIGSLRLEDLGLEPGEWVEIDPGLFGCRGRVDDV